MNRTAIFIVASVLGAAAVSGVAFACGFGGLGSYGNNTAITQALQSNDYNAWKDAITATLTQDLFNKEVQRYNSVQQASQLRSSIASAVASNNYTAYQQAVGNLTSYEISQDKFNALVARYNSTNSTYPLMGFGMGMMHRARWR